MNPFFNKFYGQKSKNVGCFLAFGEDWFKKYQFFLLLLLNIPVIKLWFRWILRIHKDCRYSDYIIEIMPNNYKVYLGEENGNVKLRADFRTHPKFSKRIYFAFRWWWWLLHYVDEFFKIAGLPEFQFGFDTLTAYSDPHPETSSVDGYCQVYNTGDDSYSTLRNCDTFFYSSFDYDTVGYVGTQTPLTETFGNFCQIFRIISVFNTNIGSDATISSGSYNFYLASGGSANIDRDTLYLVAASASSGNPNPNTQLIADEFKVAYVYTTQLTSTTHYIGENPDGYYYSLTLNSSGISHINKTGTERWALRSAWDVNDSFTGNWHIECETADYVHMADYTGTSRDPYLSVTYTLPTSIKTVLGLAYSSVKTVNSLAKASIKQIMGLT